jgi:phosphoribosyl-AMP cyclohydrolase
MPAMNEPDWLEQVNWNADGLLPVVTQDHATGRVLMLAWMNREALGLTCTEGRAVYWSRSRNSLWRKGEQSGFEQRIREIRLDCDRDTLLLRVDQQGGIACHTGRESCFFLRKTEAGWEEADPVIKDPETIYDK